MRPTLPQPCKWLSWTCMPLVPIFQLFLPIMRISFIMCNISDWDAAPFAWLWYSHLLSDARSNDCASSKAFLNVRSFWTSNCLECWIPGLLWGADLWTSCLVNLHYCKILPVSILLHTPWHRLQAFGTVGYIFVIPQTPKVLDWGASS